VRESNHPEDVTVVTTDQELTGRVTAERARVIRSGDFYHQMLDAFADGDDPPGDKACEKPDRPAPEEIDYFLREFGEDN
jgi:hypothetical protein